MTPQEVVDGFAFLLALLAVAALVVFLFGVWLLAAGSTEFAWICLTGAGIAYGNAWFWALQLVRWIREGRGW